ncbi:MAG: Ig-like domain-containing protein, partial [Pseudomonadota bacterium]
AGLTASSTLAITITPVDDITDNAFTINEDTPAIITPLANDSFENAGATITAVNGLAIVAGGPAVILANGSVSLDGLNVLTFTPNANYNGPASFTYTVTSGGSIETATISGTVTAVNDVPVANADARTTA